MGKGWGGGFQSRRVLYTADLKRHLSVDTRFVGFEQKFALRPSEVFEVLDRFRGQT